MFGCSLKVSTYITASESAHKCRVSYNISRLHVVPIGLQGAVWGLSPEADGAQWSSEAVVAETAAFHLAAVLNVAAGGF